MTAEIPETIENDVALTKVDDLDQFVRLLSGWHSQRVAELEALLSIPEGIEVAIDDGEHILLEGATRLAFIAGVTVALMKLGELPFVAETENAPIPH